MKKIVLFANENNISLPNERSSKCYHRKLPTKLAVYITELPTAEESMIIKEDDVRTKIFY